MNTGDLQYVGGNLYVAGTVTSKGGGPSGGITAVTASDPLTATTTGTTVALSIPENAYVTSITSTVDKINPSDLDANGQVTLDDTRLLDFPNAPSTAYDDTLNYTVFDCATDAQLNTYYAIQPSGPSTALQPLTNAAYWRPFAGSGSGGPPVNMFYGGDITVPASITGVANATPNATSTNFRSVAFQSSGFQTDGSSTYVFSGIVTFVLNLEFIPASFAALGTTTVYLCEQEISDNLGGIRPVGQNIIAILQLSAYELWPLFNNGNSAATITRSVNAVIKSTTAGPISLGVQNSSIQTPGSNMTSVDILVSPGVSYLSYQRFPAPPAVAEASAFVEAPAVASLSIPPAVRLLSAAPLPRARAAPKAASAGVTRKPTLSSQLKKK